MKVLVTGSQGQLARSLAERAVNHPQIELVTAGRPELDLAVPGSGEAAVRSIAPDVVINAAAYTAVDQAEDEPDRAMRVNGEAAGELAGAARAIGAPIIQISTDYVFDGHSAAPYAEDAPTNPIGAYGRSKLAGEERVRQANPDHLILRTAWVYSPFGHNFVKTMMRLAQTRDRITVVADQIGNPSSALDLADGIFAMLERWRGGERSGLGGTYHLAGTGSASWFDFARAIFDECRAQGLPAAEVEAIRTADWPTMAARPANSQLDSSKFERDFGWQMPEWQEGLADVVSRIASRQGSQRTQAEAAR